MINPLTQPQAKLSTNGNTRPRKSYRIPKEAGTFDLMAIWKLHAQECNDEAKEQIHQSVQWTISQVSDSLKLVYLLLEDRNLSDNGSFSSDRQVLELLSKNALLHSEILEHCTDILQEVDGYLTVDYGN